MLDFYCFEADTLSTFSMEAKNEYESYGYKLKDTVKVKVDTLEDICNKYVGSNVIDFISIDVEGFEMQVLNSNNWNKNKPKLIILESNGSQKKPNVLYEHVDFLKPLGYKLVYFNGLNSFFKLNQ